MSEDLEGKYPMNETGLDKKGATPSPISFASEPNWNAEPKKTLEQPSMTSFASYSGPTPPPVHLIEYEKIVPGIAKRFLEEPHTEAEHRRTLEKMMAHEQIKLSNRGQMMAFSLAGFCIVGAFTAIFMGHSLEGLGALITSIGVFACIFFYSKRRQ